MLSWKQTRNLKILVQNKIVVRPWTRVTTNNERQEVGTARKCYIKKFSSLHRMAVHHLWPVISFQKSHIVWRGKLNITLSVHRLYDRHHHHHQQNAIRPAHQHPLAAIFVCLTCFFTIPLLSFLYCCFNTAKMKPVFAHITLHHLASIISISYT